MSYKPCENRSCKSYGKPHPNCKCHPGMAKGGVVELFCSTSKPHKKGCKYFASGGEVSIDPNEVIVDTPDINPDEVVVDDPGLEIDPSEVILDSEKHGTTGQKILTGIEGASQGVLGPIAVGAELGLANILESNGIDKKYLPTREDIAGRQKENPVEHGVGEVAGLIGSTVAGFGQGALAAKMATNVMGKTGSVFLKNAIPSMAISTSDEITKSLLGIGDPTDAAAAVLASGAFGGLAGKAMQGIGNAANKVGKMFLGDEDIALGTYMQDYLKGIGWAHGEQQSIGSMAYDALSKYEKHLVDNPASIGSKGFEAGKHFYDNYIATFKNTMSNTGFKDVIEFRLPDLIRRGITGSVVSKVGKYATPTILKVLSNSEGEFIPPAKLLDFAKSVDHGEKLITEKVNKCVVQPASQQFSKTAKDVRSFDDFKNYILNGGIDQNTQEQIYKDNTPQEVPSFAEGGIVAQRTPPINKGRVAPLLQDHDPVQQYFPDQNMILQGAKVRVSNYLTSIKPNKNPPMLPFDRKPNQAMKEKSFDKAISIAMNPLSVMDKIQQGRLTKEDLTHFDSMYPELKGHLQKQITKRIVDAQVKGEKLNKHSKQSLSVFMGAPMESTMKQPMLAAAQATFSMQNPDKQQQVKKKGTSALSKESDQHKTSSDAGVARTQTSKL